MTTTVQILNEGPGVIEIKSGNQNDRVCPGVTVQKYVWDENGITITEAAERKEQ